MPNTGNATAAAMAAPAVMASALADQMHELIGSIADSGDGAALGHALNTRLRWLRGCLERVEADLYLRVERYADQAAAELTTDPFKASA